MSEEELKSKYDVLVRSNAMNYKEAQDYKKALLDIKEKIENKMLFCTNEANGTTNDKICRITMLALKDILDIVNKVLEVGGSNE